MLNSISVKSSLFPTICQNPADLFESFTRSEIRCPHQEDNMIHKRKSVVQHESLHLSVVSSTPIGAGKERPADLKFARLRSVPEAFVGGQTSTIQLSCLTVLSSPAVLHPVPCALPFSQVTLPLSRYPVQSRRRLL
jgi:hypothetical protein